MYDASVAEKVNFAMYLELNLPGVNHPRRESTQCKIALAILPMSGLKSACCKSIHRKSSTKSIQHSNLGEIAVQMYTAYWVDSCWADLHLDIWRLTTQQGHIHDTAHMHALSRISIFTAHNIVFHRIARCKTSNSSLHSPLIC